MLIVLVAQLMLVMGVLGLDTDSALLLTTATFALVYLAGTAAALALLEGWSRVAAGCSVVASAGFVAVTGWRVLVPVVVGGLGVVWSRARSRAGSASPS